MDPKTTASKQPLTAWKLVTMWSLVLFAIAWPFYLAWYVLFAAEKHFPAVARFLDLYDRLLSGMSTSIFGQLLSIPVILITVGVYACLPIVLLAIAGKLSGRGGLWRK